VRKIIKLENSFLYGLTETITNNLDYNFRYLFLIAWIMQISIQFTTQFNQYYILGIGFVLAATLLLAYFYSLISYRKKASSLKTGQAIFFYFKCKCFKTV